MIFSFSNCWKNTSNSTVKHTHLSYKNTMIKIELMESFAHLTDIIYVNLGRPNKSLFFQNWDYSSSTMMQNNIHHSDSDTAANSSSASGRSEAGYLEAGMLFHHYEMSALEHHLTHWLKNKKRKFNSLLTNFLISIVCNIEHCQ